MSSGFGTPAGASSTSTIGQTSALASGFGGASITSGGAAGAAGASGSTGGTLGSLSGSASGGIGPIVGVGTAATGTSIAAPNQQATYETWEFWYDPRIELMYQKGQQNAGMGTGALTSQPASSFGTILNGQPNASPGSTSGAGSSFGSGFGSGSVMGSGTGSSTPATPTPPQ